MELNDVFYENDYSKAFEYVQAHEFTTIKEIEANEGGRRFQLVKWTIDPLAKINEEYKNLIEWFDTTYTRKEQKYRRLISLGQTEDDGSDPQELLTALYVTAETNRKHIQELEVEIAELEANNG